MCRRDKRRKHELALLAYIVASLRVKDRQICTSTAFAGYNKLHSYASAHLQRARTFALTRRSTARGNEILRPTTTIHTAQDHTTNMAGFNRSEFVDLTKPLGERLSLYDPTRPPYDQPKNDAADPTKAVPQAFIDAMTVREEVYVKEQNIPLENELDEDDARSFHWVAYASIPVKAVATNGNGNDQNARKHSDSTKIPIGTIRLVPPPHPAHPGHEFTKFAPGNGDSTESYIKLGRLAVIPEFRKAGVSKLLIESALTYAREHPYEVGPQLDPASLEALKKGMALNFRGLVLIHAQTGVQKVWKRYGFETDEGAGEWDEEGIPHVLMWKRLDVSDGRRKSKIWLTGNPTSP